MKDENKTKEQLISELSELRQTITELRIIETKKEERYRNIQQLEEQLAADRKQAEEALYKSESNLRKITDNMMDMIRSTDVKGIIEYATPSHMSILGYLPEDLMGRSVLDLIHPDDVEKLINANKLCAKSNSYSSRKLEYRIKHADGHYVWLETIGNLIIDENNQFSGVIYCSRDITNRKQAEKALALSEEKYSKAFRCIPDLITITTLKEGRFIEVNDTFLYILGYERHEIIGHCVKDIGLWVIPEERYRLMKQVQEQGIIHNLETCFYTKSRRNLTILLSVDIINMEGESLLLCVGKDISDRKRIEKSLRLTEERLTKAFNASPISMGITTLEDGRFIDVNDSFLRFVGLKHEEIIGRTSLEIDLWVNPTERHLVKRKLIEGSVVRDLEVRFRNTTGEQRLGIYSAERIDIDGEECILSTFTDITEQRQMEIEMLRLDRLNLVGEMAASIGHEIRNPMTSVRGFLQMFEDRYSEDKEFLNLMIEELDRANAIITEFLSLAKNKMVELIPKKLNSILKNILPLVQASASFQDKSIRFEMEHLPELLLDEKEIRQLILNLVHNGLESMSSGGTMTIKTFTEGDNVVLSIGDQGHGIEPEVLEKLGTPFFTTKETGTGLGLAVCYGIAKRHNARINVETSSAGTTFYLCFPSLADC
ncbi:MAG: hypothetical protein CVU90_09050 [Firmicutes bacterium HGW-Firmicutes-15]|nr:MAG: hypothetical protein CVU90_09050 [Firmicutes bacterium HGW-Firmicutes-15]